MYNNNKQTNANTSNPNNISSISSGSNKTAKTPIQASSSHGNTKQLPNHMMVNNENVYAGHGHQAAVVSSTISNTHYNQHQNQLVMANHANQKLDYSQMDNTLSRSGSVKSVASDSGIGSSSPLSDCSDNGNASTNNNANTNTSQNSGTIQMANKMPKKPVPQPNNNNSDVMITHVGQIQGHHTQPPNRPNQGQQQQQTGNKQAPIARPIAINHSYVGSRAIASSGMSSPASFQNGKSQPQPQQSANSDPRANTLQSLSSISSLSLASFSEATIHGEHQQARKRKLDSSLGHVTGPLAPPPPPHPSQTMYYQQQQHQGGEQFAAVHSVAYSSPNHDRLG